MRHLKAGQKLGVTPDHRRALLRSLTLALMEHESIRTTRSRAKALRSYADHMVTLAKRGDLSSRRRMFQILGSAQTYSSQNRVRSAMEKMYSEIAPRFKDRAGGYTQILKLVDRRPGDNAEMCVIRYLPHEEKTSGKSESKNKKPAKPVAKKKVEASAVGKDVADKPVKKNTKKKSAEAEDKT